MPEVQNLPSGSVPKGNPQPYPGQNRRDPPTTPQPGRREGEGFMKPATDVTQLDVAFGRIKGLMPAIDLNERPRGWGAELFSRLFFNGGKFELEAKPGIDRSAALKHIRAIMGSFEPKHEHKEAACAYLFELWFEPPGSVTASAPAAGGE